MDGLVSTLGTFGLSAAGGLAFGPIGMAAGMLLGSFLFGSPRRRADRCGVVEDAPARAPKGQPGFEGWSGRAAQGVAGSAATTVVAPRRSSQSPRGVRPIRTTA